MEKENKKNNKKYGNLNVALKPGIAFLCYLNVVNHKDIFFAMRASNFKLIHFPSSFDLIRPMGRVIAIGYFFAIFTRPMGN